MDEPDPRPGDVFESRDRQYEPGRRIRLVQAHVNNRWEVEVIADPNRQHTVGTTTWVSGHALRTKWRRVEEVTVD